MRTTLGNVALGMIVRDFVSAEPILALFTSIRLDGGADAGGTRQALVGKTARL